MYKIYNMPTTFFLNLLGGCKYKSYNMTTVYNMTHAACTLPNVTSILVSNGPKKLEKSTFLVVFCSRDEFFQKPLFN